MVTFPAGSTPESRAFRERQDQITQKLRWAPFRSRRRQKLESELAGLVHQQLALENGDANLLTSKKKNAAPKSFWWDK